MKKLYEVTVSVQLDGIKQYYREIEYREAKHNYVLIGEIRKHLPKLDVDQINSTCGNGTGGFSFWCFAFEDNLVTQQMLLRHAAIDFLEKRQSATTKLLALWKESTSTFRNFKLVRVTHTVESELKL